jgi:hypothetical protein
MSDRLPTWLGVVPALALLGLHLAYYGYIDPDDAYISYRYAQNFAAGDGLVFNPGRPPVEGYSNFLWTLALAGGARLGLDIVVSAKTLGAALAALALAGTARLLTFCGYRNKTVWIACLWLATSGSYAMWSISGMESALVAALLVLSLLLLTQEEQRGRGFASGFTLALLALSRAEGAIFFAAALAVRGWNHLQGSSKRTLLYDGVWALAFLVPVGAHLAWRAGYYGAWLPNSVSAKSGGAFLYHAMRGAYYLFQFMGGAGALLVLLVLLAGLLKPRQPLVRHGLAGTAAYIGLITLAGGDWMPQFRFFAPLMPWLCALGSVGLAALVNRWPAGRPRAGLALQAITALLVAGLLAGGSIQSQEIDRTARKFVAASPGNHLRAGWLREHTHPGDVVALLDVGILGFETDLTVIDMAGLNDAHIAHLEPRFPVLPTPGYGFGKWDVDYVLAQEPVFIQIQLSREKWEAGDLTTGWHGSDELINDPRFQAAYTYVEDPAVGGLFRRVLP